MDIIGVVPHLKSGTSFIRYTEPIDMTAKSARVGLWRERIEPLDASVHLIISADEPSSWRREPLDNLEGTQQVADTGWTGKSEHAQMGLLERTRNM